ncbi:MAG: cell division protein ZapA [Vicinamibacterales bacterium]|nr:cell division protein ZapA [Vicinamibacterales bacterium]
MADGLVPVEILGQRFPVRSTLDERYVQDLANYVDEKMKAAEDVTPGSDALRVALVAALNLADELFRSRGLGDGTLANLADRVARLERLVDQALEG